MRRWLVGTSAVAGLALRVATYSAIMPGVCGGPSLTAQGLLCLHEGKAHSPGGVARIADSQLYVCATSGPRASRFGSRRKPQLGAATRIRKKASLMLPIHFPFKPSPHCTLSSTAFLGPRLNPRPSLACMLRLSSTIRVGDVECATTPVSWLPSTAGCLHCESNATTSSGAVPIRDFGIAALAVACAFAAFWRCPATG